MNDTHPTENKTPTLGQEVTPPPPKPEKKAEPAEHRHRMNPGQLLFGISLVIIGLLYLAETTGWIDLQFSFWQLWPLLIVFFGISMLTRSSWSAWFIVVLVILLIGFFASSFFWTTDRETETRDISVALAESVTEADVHIYMGAGSLRIDESTTDFAQGGYKSNVGELQQTEAIADGVQSLNLRTEGDWRGFGSRVNELNLALLRDVPIDLIVESGAMSMDLDFSENMLRTLEIDTGASSLDLTLGNLLESADVRIDAGASSVDITLPTDVGVELRLDAGLSSKNLQGFTEAEEDLYRSENFDETTKRINMDLDLGVSSLSIGWDE